ncbi:unnamed protein product [Adineta steineri]|uniref:Nucleotide-diphospho-sugar transferase domain-containing protein n=1 Tax=Adineta steineri TaxID=433720 RepID=A0A815QJK3_9BILA|nr:unnamed protein product [Adineta steineri]
MMSMGYNLLCSLRKLRVKSLADKIIFWAVDEEAVTHLQLYRKKNNLSFGIYHPDTKHQISKFQNPGSHGYNQMMRDRAYVYITLIRQYRLSLLFMDADIIFTADPLPDLFLNEDRGQSEDIIYSTDARNFYNALKDPYEGGPFIPMICGGFFLMRPTEPTIHLLEDLSKTIDIDLNANDQWTTHKLLNSRYNSTSNTFIHDPTRTWLVEPFPTGLERRNKSVRTNSSIKLRLLEQGAYINGHIYGSLHNQYWQEIQKIEKSNPFFQRIMIHANTWAEDKLQLMKRNHLWFLGSDDVCIL